jgi:hypothetical protein
MQMEFIGSYRRILIHCCYDELLKMKNQLKTGILPQLSRFSNLLTVSMEIEKIASVSMKRYSSGETKGDRCR